MEQVQETLKMMQAEIHRLDREHQEMRVSVGKLVVEVDNHGETLGEMRTDTKQIRRSMDTLVKAEDRRKTRDDVYDRLWKALPILGLLLGGLYWLIEHTVPVQAVKERQAYGATATAIHSPSDASDGGGNVPVLVDGMGPPVR